MFLSECQIKLIHVIILIYISDRQSSEPLRVEECACVQVYSLCSCVLSASEFIQQCAVSGRGTSKWSQIGPQQSFTVDTYVDREQHTKLERNAIRPAEAHCRKTGGQKQILNHTCWDEEGDLFTWTRLNVTFNIVKCWLNRSPGLPQGRQGRVRWPDGWRLCSHDRAPCSGFLLRLCRWPLTSPWILFIRNLRCAKSKQGSYWPLLFTESPSAPALKKDLWHYQTKQLKSQWSRHRKDKRGRCKQCKWWWKS